MITAFQKIKTPPLWAKCLIVSLTIHSAAIYVLVQNPILLSKSWGSFFSPSKPSPKYISVDEDWSPDTLVLQHFFEEFPSPSKKVELPTHISSLTSLLPSQETGEEIVVNLPPAFFLKEKQQAQKNLISSFSSFEYSEENTEALIQPAFIHPTLPKATYIQSTLHGISLDPKAINRPLEDDNVPIAPTPAPSKEIVHKNSLTSSDKSLLQENQKEFPVVAKSPFSKPEEVSIATIPTPYLTHFTQETPLQILAKISLSEINDYLPEDLVSAIEWNDDFDIKATLFPEKEGYVFSLAVTPRMDLHQQKIKQNFYFLIDASSEIEKHKLSVFKRSVLKALAALQPGDSFNIFLLDKKITKFSPTNLFVSPKNLALAEEFLEKKGEDRAFFSTLNLNQTLNALLKDIEADDEVHTALLLSNGKSSLDPKEMRLFLEKNHGKLNLFTAAVGQNNQLTFLDMISSFCGGSLFYSDTNASFPRKLALFIKSLEAPLAKNLTLSLNPSNPKASVEFSSTEHMPNLYSQAPFVIMGKMDRLCDLHLVLQGKSAEDQIFLKKIIHFEEATPPENSVKKQWVLHQKTAFYEKFLKESKPLYLKNAMDILKSVHGKAFGE